MVDLGFKKLLGNVASTMARQILSGLLQIATLILIARAYGPEGSGAYALALLLPTMLATLLNLGIGPANVYYLGAGKVNPNQAWRVTLRIALYIILFGAVLGGTVIYFYSDEWFPGVSDAVLWLSLGTFPIIFLCTAIGNIFQGLQEFHNFNFVLFLQPFTNLILVACVILLRLDDVFFIVASYFISSSLNLILGCALLNASLKLKNGVFVNSYAKHLIGYGYKAHLSNILAFVNNRADMLLLGFFIGPVAVGIYAVAVNLVEKLWLFSGAVSTVLLPRLSQLSNDEAKRNLLTPLIARWSLWITLVAALAFAVLGNLIIGVFFGDAFLEAYSVLVWLLPGVVLGSCSMVLANDMAARGRPDLNLATSWVSVTINITGNIILIPQYGLQGAAGATSFAYVVNMMMRLAIHSHFTGVTFTRNLFMNGEDWRIVRAALQKAGWYR